MEGKKEVEKNRKRVKGSLHLERREN